MFWYVCFRAARRCLMLLPRGLKHRSTLVVALFYFAAFKPWIPFCSMTLLSVDLQFFCAPRQNALPRRYRPFLVRAVFHLGLITIHASVLNYPGQYVLTIDFVPQMGKQMLRISNILPLTTVNCFFFHTCSVWKARLICSEISVAD